MNLTFLNYTGNWTATVANTSAKFFAVTIPAEATLNPMIKVVSGLLLLSHLMVAGVVFCVFYHGFRQKVSESG